MILEKALYAGLVVGLMAFGLADSLALRVGPLGLFAAWRRVLQASLMPAWLREHADCVYCWSFWVACFAAALFADPGMPPIDVLATWLMGAGVSAFLLKYTGH